MDTEFENEKVNKTISLTTSILFHLFVFVLVLFWPSMRYNFPPPGKEGILVMFGDVQEAGESTATGDIEDEKKEKQKDSAKKLTEQVDKKNKTEDKTEFKKVLTEENDLTVEDSKKEKETGKEAVIPEKSLDDAKNAFGKLFNSRGTKKNNLGGTQGDPLGSRDSEVLEGISRGKGKIGEGLDSRGILYEPNFEDFSQKSGRVVVKICINETGNVISSRYTQRGSSTTDSELIAIAVKNAKKYRFTPSNKKEQCGSIVIDFIVK